MSDASADPQNPFLSFLRIDPAQPPSIVWIVLISLVVWGGPYALRGLWEPDEARYVYVAQEMVQTDHWLVPQRNGTWYAHKPPLMFWLIRLSTAVTGGEFNGISGRLPTLLGAILALWAITRLDAAWFGRAGTWRTFFITITSLLFWMKAGMGQMDMLLLGLQLMAVFGLFRGEASGSTPWRALAFLCAGLAVLVKGPVGFLIPIGIYCVARIAAGEETLLARRYWLWGLPLALLPVSAWLFLAYISGAPAAYFQELLWDQNVGRVAGTFGSHYQPVYYYLKYLVIDFLPWSFFVPAALIAVKSRHDLKVPMRRVIGWIVFVVVFFSVATGKRNLYILSVYPAAAMLIATAIPSLRDLRSRWRTFGAVGVIGLFLLFALVWPAAYFIDKIPLSPNVFAPVSVTATVAVVVLGFSWWRLGPQPNWFRHLIAGMLLLELAAGYLVLPRFDAIKVPQHLAQRVQEVVPRDEPLLLYGMNGEIFAFHAKRRGQRIDDLETLEDAMRQYKRGIVVFFSDTWKDLESQLGRYGQVVCFSMGSKELCWLEYTHSPDKPNGAP